MLEGYDEGWELVKDGDYQRKAVSDIEDCVPTQFVYPLTSRDYREVPTVQERNKGIVMICLQNFPDVPKVDFISSHHAKTWKESVSPLAKEVDTNSDDIHRFEKVGDYMILADLDKRNTHLIGGYGVFTRQVDGTWTRHDYDPNDPR